MTDWTGALAPSLDDVASLAEAAFANLPDPFRSLAGKAIFRVLDFADDETLASLGLEDPFELTGLYEGVDLTRQSVLDPSPQPAAITLYRRPILDEWCESGEDLYRLVRHVLIHEIGHHFGFSDEDMEALEETAGD